MKSKGEIESAVAEALAAFEQQYMGRGPKQINAHLVGDLLVVRLRGVLTSAEQQLVRAMPEEKGRDLLKQVRRHLLETARPLLAPLIEADTGRKLVSLHHDVSTLTGEEVIVFTLDGEPGVRETKKR